MTKFRRPPIKETYTLSTQKKKIYKHNFNGNWSHQGSNQGQKKSFCYIPSAVTNNNINNAMAWDAMDAAAWEWP